MRGTIYRDLKRLISDAKLCELFFRLTSRWTSYDSPKPEAFTGMDTSCLCIFTVYNKCFQKRKISGCDLATKIHFQFWQLLLQDPRRLLVLFLELLVLEEQHSNNNKIIIKYYRQKYLAISPNYEALKDVELTILFLIFTFKFRLFALVLSFAVISATSSPSSSSSSAT